MNDAKYVLKCVQILCSQLLCQYNMDISFQILFAYYVDCISNTGMVLSSKKRTRNFVGVIVVVG